MSSNGSPAIVWFRSDLRLTDHRALTEAVESGRPLIACFVLDDTGSADWPPGGASRWWLHHSLTSLAGGLEELGGQLILRQGVIGEVLVALTQEAGAVEIHCSASPEPAGASLEGRLRSELQARGVELHCHPGALLIQPDAVRTKGGRPFQVFTPFWKACLQLPEPGVPLPAPRNPKFFAGALESETLSQWKLLPKHPDWAAGFSDVWVPGERSALRRINAFLDTRLAGYTERRDFPGEPSTSSLSPYLHFGELSPRQVWHAVRSVLAVNPSARSSGEGFLRQLGWREFSHYLLHHWPTLPNKAFRPEFEAFPWEENQEWLESWQQGETGYPIVDAGMRQLWRTGWMHNRVRMVAASFLVKHLLIPWQDGAAWFWDTLVDADMANNSAGWQWVAGSGADAAPYFRIFNPVLQGKKFDADGDYVRRWVHELSSLPTKYIHDPWNAPVTVLDDAGVVLGSDYPMPVVDHGQARARALAAYAELKSMTL